MFTLPTTGYIGPDSFTYHANDGVAISNVVPVFTVNAYTVQLLINGSFENGYTGWTRYGVQRSNPTDSMTPRTGSTLLSSTSARSRQHPFANLPDGARTVYQLTFDQDAIGTPGVKHVSVPSSDPSI